MWTTLLTLTQSPIYLFILWFSSLHHLSLLVRHYFMFLPYSNQSSLLFTGSLLIHLSLSLSITPPTHTHTLTFRPLQMSVCHINTPHVVTFFLLCVPSSIVIKHFSHSILLPASSSSPHRCSVSDYITLHTLAQMEKRNSELHHFIYFCAFIVHFYQLVLILFEIVIITKSRTMNSSLMLSNEKYRLLGS